MSCIILNDKMIFFFFFFFYSIKNKRKIKLSGCYWSTVDCASPPKGEQSPLIMESWRGPLGWHPEKTILMPKSHSFSSVGWVKMICEMCGILVLPAVTQECGTVQIRWSLRFFCFFQHPRCAWNGAYIHPKNMLLIIMHMKEKRGFNLTSCI